MSKVIHVRLSDEAIYTALHIMQKSGINTTNLGLATIMRRYIEGSLENYREQVALEIPEQLEQVLENISTGEPSPIKMPDVGYREQDATHFDQDKLTNIQRAISDATRDDTAPNVEFHDPVEEARTLPPPPWEAFGIRPFSELQKVAPLDTLIEQAKDDEVLQKAVQCVYSELPTHEWGTKHTIQLVQNIVPVIQQYFTETNEDIEDERL